MLLLRMHEKKNNCLLKVPQPIVVSNEQRVEAQTPQVSIEGNYNEACENKGFSPWMLVERQGSKKKQGNNQLNNLASRLIGVRNESWLSNSKRSVNSNIAINLVTINPKGPILATQPFIPMPKYHNLDYSFIA